MTQPQPSAWAPAAVTRTSEVRQRILVQLQDALTTPEPLIALRALRGLRAELDVFERDQVRRALEAGDSFTVVARGLGISRQAAHRRYRDLLPGPPAPPRISAEVRALLRLARDEAARLGAPTVEAEHIVLGLAAGGRLHGVTVDAARALVARPRPGDGPPSRLGHELAASLGRVQGPLEVDDLVRAASEQPAARTLLERLERRRLPEGG